MSKKDVLACLNGSKSMELSMRSVDVVLNVVFVLDSRSTVEVGSACCSSTRYAVRRIGDGNPYWPTWSMMACAETATSLS